MYPQSSVHMYNMCRECNSGLSKLSYMGIKRLIKHFSQGSSITTDYWLRPCSSTYDLTTHNQLWGSGRMITQSNQWQIFDIESDKLCGTLIIEIITQGNRFSICVTTFHEEVANHYQNKDVTMAQSLITLTQCWGHAEQIANNGYISKCLIHNQDQRCTVKPR